MAVTMQPSKPSDHSSNSMSRFLSKLSKRWKPPRHMEQHRPSQDNRPPLIPSPLPLVLPEHQHTLSQLGWTTITFPSPSPPTPSPAQQDEPEPGFHPLQQAYRDVFHAAQQFFDSPDEEKEHWKHKLGSEEGWSKIPGEKEFITLRTLAYTPDVLKAPAKRYWDLMGAHLSSTLGRISTSLALPPDPDAGLRKFVSNCATIGTAEEDKTATMLRIFRYESWEPKVVAEPHADLGLLSVVVGDVPGLEVWDGRAWFGVERGYSGRQASMLVGRQLERYSNFRYPAGGHRVVSYGEPPVVSSPELGHSISSSAADTNLATERKQYRHSIVFVLRAHEPVVIHSDELETQITGKWQESVNGMTAGELYEQIRKKHFNINIGHEEREKQRRKVLEAKKKGQGKTGEKIGREGSG